MPRYTQQQRDEMATRYAAGEGLVQIAERFGCSPTTVSAAKRHAGIERRRPTRRLVHRWGRWRRSKQSNGYIAWSAWDAETGKTTFLLEHRLLMSWMLGRPLVRGENVHHRNGVRDDNRPENLELWVTTQPSGISVCPHCGESLTA